MYFHVKCKSINLTADNDGGESMRKQGSLLVVWLAACVGLFAACVPWGRPWAQYGAALDAPAKKRRQQAFAYTLIANAQML